MGSAIPVSRLGDTGSGHGSFPPTNVITCSINTFVNNKGVGRKGDQLQPHGSPSPSPVHSRSLCGCSSKTIVNNKGVVRIGDAICCGGLMVQGSPNVFKG